MNIKKKARCVRVCVCHQLVFADVSVLHLKGRDGHDDGERRADADGHYPHEQQDHLGAKLGRLELERIDDGVVALVRYGRQRHHACHHRNILFFFVVFDCI